MGYKLNVMTQSLEKKSPQLPLGVEVLSSYATLTTGSNKITVVLRNNTNEWVEVGGLLGPRAVRVSGTAETKRASGKPSV